MLKTNVVYATSFVSTALQAYFPWLAKNESCLCRTFSDNCFASPFFSTNKPKVKACYAAKLVIISEISDSANLKNTALKYIFSTKKKKLKVANVENLVSTAL